MALKFCVDFAIISEISILILTPLHELNPDLPCSKPLSDILKRMMAKNPNQRYDAAALLRDIDRLHKYYQSGEKLELKHDEDNSSVFYRKKRLTAK